MNQGCLTQHEDRMSRLTKALDFFSQVLSVEQLTLYGFAFIQEILSLEEATLYMRTVDGHYEVCNYSGCNVSRSLYQDNGKLDAIAKLLGRSLWRDFNQYFDHEFIEVSQMGIVIPIIMQDRLMGFIVSKGIREEHRGLVDETFVESIKNIMNMAFYMAITHETSKVLESEVNKRIYNLFFVNQSTRVLLSEHNLDLLYQLCIDAVRELTSSSMTSFCLYDDIRERILVKSFNDIVTFKKNYKEFILKTRKPKSGRMVFNIKRHRSELAEIVENIEDFDDLGATHVILLVKEDIIGFVTVGEPVNQVPYDEELLSQIESLASSIYISITNALFIKQIQIQNETIEQQLKTLKNLNRTLKNINTCQTIEEICEIMLTTLEISHGVKTAFMATRVSNDAYKIMGSIGACGLNGLVYSTQDLHEKCQSSFYYDYDVETAKNHLPWRLMEKMSFSGCLVVSPLKLDVLEESGSGVVAYMVIAATDRNFRQDDLCAVETISNLAAPIIRQMQISRDLEEKLKPDDRVLFFEALEEYLSDKDEYQVDFRVYYKKLEQGPFKSPDLQSYRPYKYYVFDGYLYVMIRANSRIDYTLFDASVEGHMVQALTGDFTGNATA